VRKLLKLIAVLLFAAITQASHADVTFNLDTVINGDTPSGSSPWLTATFTNIATDQVELTLANNMGSGQYISDLLFSTSISNPTSLTVSPSPSPYTGSISISTDQTLAGDPSVQAGLFNINIPFTGSIQFNGTNSPVNLFLSASGLTEDSFNLLSADGGTSNPGGWLMAAEVQGIPVIGGGTTSGSIGFTNVSAVPEPEIYAMMGVGLLLIGFVVHRRRP